MDIKFQKIGTVKIVNGEEDQINLVNPVGQPLNVSIDMLNELIVLEFRAQDEDGRNAITRRNEITMDAQSTEGFLKWFTEDLRRLARDQYQHFADLTEIQPSK